MAKSFLNIAGYPKGLRNNNPGNIRPGDNWQGMIGTNGGFVVFKDIAYGIRAMATDIGNDIRNKGLNTIAKLVSEYAPPSENDTMAYIRSVVSYTGIPADQLLPADHATLRKLIRAHMNVELGKEYSSLIADSDIDEGLGLMNEGLKQYFKIGVAAASVGLFIAIGVVAWLVFRKKQ